MRQDRRLGALLEKAIRLDRATKGNIQAFDAEAGVLRIVAQRGFDREFLRHFAEVRPLDASACGRAFGAGGCVLIPDVLRDEAFAPHREIALSSGFRSVKSVPVPGPDGRLVGVLSTHGPDVRWDWERDNTTELAAEIGLILAEPAPQTL